MEELLSTRHPQVPFQTEQFRRSRPTIVGPEEPSAPFPIKLAGPVQKGFGRGGKDLGCPTGMQIVVVLTRLSVLKDMCQRTCRMTR